ncbi:uncharacterized protein DUF998 [Hasllibacter halocynthiae]|uniref:Uncharacterized protein DUF998 n=1 Tax=Hasllibacter halocynthiae TaxID=595589 RepID=A0A2T0X6K5_9RHOB|nr:DUF998 domain-containing protein [Hasllibacter halocynthiae]PRY94566.1 uncharacterized protein DUF998 [Hasllibacter halocynthiae]
MPQIAPHLANENISDFASFSGLAGFAGILCMAVGVIAGDMMVPGNDWIADTISAMAAGNPLWWIVDGGIVLYGFAVLVMALGCASVHPGGRRFSVGCVGLALLGVTIFLIGFRNEYGDGDAERGEEFHTYFVYLIGALFAAVPWMLSGGLAAFSRPAARALRWGAAAWIVAAPWFFFMPDGYDGLYERGLGLISFWIVGAIAAALLPAERGA